MDPGDVPEELQGLTEIEEMLIAQVFTVMSVYRLRGDNTDTVETSSTSLKTYKNLQHTFHIIHHH